MLKPQELRIAGEILPFLNDPTTPIGRDFATQATLLHLPAGTTIFQKAMSVVYLLCSAAVLCVCSKSVKRGEKSRSTASVAARAAF
jgi:hypothetical protein